VTAKTRRRVVGCVVAIALTLPLESILLQAIATPNSKLAVRQWVASLSPEDLLSAAGAIESYPVMYRKEIMRALTPELRAYIWRAHIQAYIDTHPHLSSDAIPALEAALALITPDLFETGGSKRRAETALIADQISALLGRAEAEYLLYRLGPKDEQTASIEPLGMRLANYVRDMLVVLATADNCDCASGWGCDGYESACRTNGSCNPDTDWPMCGWLWNEECDGVCSTNMSMLYEPETAASAQRL
jgi:hypothetical protein